MRIWPKLLVETAVGVTVSYAPFAPIVIGVLTEMGILMPAAVLSDCGEQVIV
jgi:hypothetical protein